MIVALKINGMRFFKGVTVLSLQGIHAVNFLSWQTWWGKGVALQSFTDTLFLSTLNHIQCQFFDGLLNLKGQNFSPYHVERDS